MADRPIRMLFVQGAAVRAGAERALLARLRHLPEHGIEPLVAFVCPDGPFRGEVERAGVRTVLLARAPRAREPLGVASAIRDLTGLARRERIAVMEGCGEKMSLLAGWAARLAGCGSVFNLQDEALRRPSAGALQLAAVSGRHDAVVVPSAWMAAGFRRLGLRPETIPNGLVLDDLPDEGSDVRARAGWGRGTVVVGHFGRLVPWKGLDVLLSAARAAVDEAPDMRFLLAGGMLYGRDPGYEAHLHDSARRLGLEEAVRFTGHRDDALELMAGCDVVCHCSLRREPFGMAVLEGMALGKPVVASRAGGPGEMIEHGRTGMLVDPGDDRALSRELIALAGAPARREAVGAAASEEARGRYRSEVVGARLAAVYRRAAAR